MYFFQIFKIVHSRWNLMVYDGGNIEQRTIGYGSCQNQEAKIKIVGGVYLDPSNKKLIQPAAK